MRVVILCGGMGTRLREETEFRPKPLVEIGGEPILWPMMKIYSRFGFHDFVRCLGYKGQMIKEYFLNCRVMNRDFTRRLDSPDNPEFHAANTYEPWSITFVDTGAEAMTGCCPNLNVAPPSGRLNAGWQPALHLKLGQHR
ncbi:MAG: sugar phosphate nucleotidyltransferase [Terriglobia bacterium]